MEGARIIQEADKGDQLSLRQFTLARDYLLCRLKLATGTRPSAFNNILVSDYETSRVSEGNRIILMPKHKRTKDGPAMPFDPQMQAKMAIYIKKIRPPFPNLEWTSCLSKTMEMGSQRGPLEGVWWLSYKRVV